MKRHSRPPLQVHTPEVHASEVAESHALPQAPQLLSSLEVFLQRPPQHCSLPAQVRPHAPQLPTPSSETHAPPQQPRPPDVPHVVPLPHRHTPPMHVSPVGQPPGHVAA